MFSHIASLNPLVQLPFNHPVQTQRKRRFDQEQLVYHCHVPEDLPSPNYGFPMEFYIARKPLPHEVKIELHNLPLWNQFNAETTEMIITKNGRRMFPFVEITISGLEPHKNYCILFELAPSSDRRQKYIKNGESVDETDFSNIHQQPCTRGWIPTTYAEQQPRLERRLLLHPDSPALGSHWMNQKPISFSKVKITNDTSSNQQNQILLTSMHKYHVRIWVVMCDNILYLNEYYSYPSAIYTLKETEFIAVTAYQNENIIKLKIDKNPFAKGFRKDGQSRCKRKSLKDKNIAGNYTEEEKDYSAEGKDHLSEEEIDVISLKSPASLNDSSSIDSYENNYNNKEIPSSSLSNTSRTSQNNDEKTQPQFHRPWTDGDEIEKSDNVLSPLPSEQATSLPISYSQLGNQYYLHSPDTTYNNEFNLIFRH